MKRLLLYTAVLLLAGPAEAQFATTTTTALPGTNTNAIASTAFVQAAGFGAGLPTAAGQVLNSTGIGLASWLATVTLGQNGGVGGSLTLNGATSGSIVLSTPSAGGQLNVSGPLLSSLGAVAGTIQPNVGGITYVGSTSNHPTGLIANSVEAVRVQTSGQLVAFNGVQVGATTNGLQVGTAPTGGDKGAGTINVQNGYWSNGTQGITNSNLANMAAGTIKANPTGSPAAPTDWAVNASNSVESTGVPGFDGQQFFIWNAPVTPSTTQNMTLRVDRNANYTGGTIGTVYNSFWGHSTVAAGVANFEWAVLGQVDNSATGGQNVGVVGYGNAKTTGTGPTWGGTFIVDDNTNTANPTNGRIGNEVDNLANGTDTNAVRVVLDLVGGKHAGAGTTPTITWGWRVGAQSGTLANATFVHGGQFIAATYTDLISSAAGAVTTNGIDFSAGTFSGSPFKSTGFAVDAAGNVTANNITSAWTAYTATPVCGSATITTNSARAKTLGKTTFVELDFTVTAIGTCVAAISFTLPNTANSGAGLVGRETVTNGTFVWCSITAASAAVTCSGNAALANTSRVVLSGVYENQ